MSLKQWSLINTAIAFLYFAVIQSGKSTGIYAVVIIIAFGLGMVVQLILAGLTRPVRINPEYVLIVTGRAGLFLATPQIKPYALSVSCFCAICILDYLQSELPTNPSMDEKLSEREVLKSARFYQTIIFGGLFIGTLISEDIVAQIAIIAIALFGILRQEETKIKMYLGLELAVTSVLCVIRYYSLLPDFLVHMLIALLYLLIVTINMRV